MYLRFNRISPVAHADDWSLVRVPLIREDGTYIVYVGDSFTRTYTDATLPDAIKMRLAMILASDQRIVKNGELITSEIYINHGPSELHDIGWQASDSYFCLVLPLQDLEDMKGDARSKS